MKNSAGTPTVVLEQLHRVCRKTFSLTQFIEMAVWGTMKGGYKYIFAE